MKRMTVSAFWHDSGEVGGCLGCDVYHTSDGQIPHKVKELQIGGKTTRLCASCIKTLLSLLRHAKASTK